MVKPMRLALITGAAGGLGSAAARRLAGDGWTIAACDRDAAQLKSITEWLPGGRHRAALMDVASEDSVRNAFEEVETQLGPIAALICFAGILSSRADPGGLAIVELGTEEWDIVMAVNARGTFLCIREMLLRRASHPVEHGRIVTVASLAGQMGAGLAGAAYGASKGAVLSLTKTAAREAAPLGITVNAIAPGPIETQMLHQLHSQGEGDADARRRTYVPLGRVGTPDEVAATVSFLVSPDAGYLTGATLDVNGGMYMR